MAVNSTGVLYTIVAGQRPPSATPTPSSASRDDVCVCARARVVSLVTDCFGALVCLVLGVWRLSWAQSLRLC
jgi:hypothetical protein